MKAVYALIIASLLMIAFGVFLILQQKPAATREAEQEQTQAPKPVLGLIPAPAPQQADSGQTLRHLKVVALPGTELWCERMLHVANTDWSREDSQTFADHCIYTD